jgi:hypothetical protein
METIFYIFYLFYYHIITFYVLCEVSIRDIYEYLTKSDFSDF